MATKARLQTAGDGTAIPSGYVGEAISSTSSSNLLQSSPAINTYYYITNAPQVTLSKGIWLITYQGLLECWGTYTSSAYVNPTIQLYNSTSAAQVQLTVGSAFQGSTTSPVSNVSSSAILTITADNTLLQLRVGIFNWTGSSTTSSLRLRGDVTTSILSAVRIA